MAQNSKQRLRFATVVYWVLLLYIIAALIWWFLSLVKQNEAMYELRKEHLMALAGRSTSFYSQLQKIEEQRRINIAKYIGEGSTFLLLILVGAFYLYRSVRRQFQQQLQQQNFTMAITHELKTPLAVARLNLETILKHQLEEAKKSKLLQMTLQETLRLDTLINNILISSQLEGDAYHVSREPMDFSELTSSSIQQFRNRYPDRQVETTLEEEVDVDGDPLLLKLLISNLLENAQKYAPARTPIYIKLRRQHAEALLEVADEGPGIPEEEKKKIFRKFYRIGNEQTRKTKGTGLGLYICKKIAKDHGGRLTVTDNQPRGSNFIVHIPLKS